MTSVCENWFVYVLLCVDGTLYTGIAKDVEKRFQQHLAGRGAKYTRTHKPSKILASIRVQSRSEALKIEWAVKQQKKSEKVSFLRSFQYVVSTKNNQR